MKTLLRISIVIFGFFITQPLFSQITWDGGASTSNWGDANNWSTNVLPTASDVVEFSSNLTINVAGDQSIGKLQIRNGASVTLVSTKTNGNISITVNTAANDAILVESGSTLTLRGNSGGSGRTLTLTTQNLANLKADIYGTIFADNATGAGIFTRGGALVEIIFRPGSTFKISQSSGTIPIATWSNTSNLDITSGSATLPASSIQYGNITISNSSTLSKPSADITVQGNLSITSGTFTNTSGNVTVNNDMTIAGGSFSQSTNGNLNNVTIMGSLNLSGGTYNFVSGSSTVSSSLNLNLFGNLIQSSTGKIVTSSRNAVNGTLFFKNKLTTQTVNFGNSQSIEFVNFSVDSNVNVTMNSAISLNIYNDTRYAGTFDVYGTLDLKSNSISSRALADSGSGAGPRTAYFTLRPGGKLITQLQGGLSEAIPTTSMSISYSSDGIYEFSRSGLQTLSGLPATIRTLTLNGSGDKSLAGPVTVTNLVFNGAYLVSTSTNLLTISANGTSSGASSSNGFVKGPVRKLGTADFEFPIGGVIKGVNRYRPVQIANQVNATSSTSFTATLVQDNPYTSASFGPYNSVYFVNEGPSSLQGMSDFEYWDIARSSTQTANLTLDWSLYPTSDAKASELRMAHYNSTLRKWENAPNASGSLTYNVQLKKLTLTNVNSFSPFTIGSLTQAALPVSLSNFTAKATIDNKVNLAWVTASESNNKGFRIERKAEGESKFNAIGFIASKAERGNSQLDLAYSFKDMTAPMGSNMYRLVQEDIDGKQTISDVKMVKLNGQSVVSVYPNPSNGAVTISRTNDGKKMNVQILDQSGRVINQYNNILDSNLRLNLPQSGIYQIKLMYPETGEQSIQRIVVQH